MKDSWDRIDGVAFIKEMAIDDDNNKEVILTCKSRPDVASLTWWVLEWTDAIGQRRSVSAQRFNLLFERAVEVEKQARLIADRHERYYLDLATHLNDDMLPLCGHKHSEGKGCIFTTLRSNVTCIKCREEIRKNDAEEVNSPYAEQQRRYERNDPNEV